jgi:hypothetical protein
MHVSEFQEIPPEESTLVRVRRSPFVVKEILRVFRGTFCFEFGQAIGCADFTFRLAKGETRTVRLGGSAKGLDIGFEKNETVSDEISYTITRCDSAHPVAEYKDSEMAVYECSARLSRHLWRWRETEFFAGSRSVIWGNVIENDASCGCDRPATGKPDPGIEQELLARLTKVIETRELTSDRIEVQPEDPGEMVRAAALVLQEAVQPNVDVDVSEDQYDIGVVSVDATTNWLQGPASSQTLSLVATDCNAMARRRLAIDRDRPLPLLGIGIDREAHGGLVRVVAAQPGQRVPEEIDSGWLEILNDRFVTSWFEADLSRLEEGASGFIEVQLSDAAGDPTGTRAELFFTVETKPAALQVMERA